MDQTNEKKPKRPIKVILIVIIVLVVLLSAWTAFSLIGRVNAETVIPDSAILRFRIFNPAQFFDKLMLHEPLKEINSTSALAPAAAFLNSLEENPLLNNRLLRLAARGNAEIAILRTDSPETETAGTPRTLIAACDLGFFSPLLRILPMLSGFVNIPNLYYVQAGKNSRFEYRMGNKTLFIGQYRNLLFITDSSAIFESRSSSWKDAAFSVIKPSSFDAALLVNQEFIAALLTDQDSTMAAVIKNIEFNSAVEAGISVYPKKIELRLTAPLSSRQTALSRLIERRSRVPDLTERLPASVQYATILSAGTLDELYQASLVFSGPVLDDTIKRADSSSRTILGLSINDLLFSWSGDEFAVFGMEGRPHPVYAIQIADERKRQAVFDKAFKSIALNENVRLNLDGVRIPRIEVPEFLQSLLRRWDIFLPSPYYTVYKDCLFASESAETLLAALRAMQRNDVLPKTAAWRNIAGGKTASGAFSLYYSLDRSLPFFLRKNTVFSGFLSLYRQGLVRMSFNNSLAEVSLALVSGSGSGVTLVNSFSVETSGRISNRVYAAGKEADSRIFLSAGSSVLSVNLADNSTRDLSGQGQHWILPAEGTGDKNAVNAWVVSERGRVTLVNSGLEPAQGFPLLTGLRLSSPPAAFGGRLYLCDEDGKVHIIDEKGGQSVWETSFFSALRSPPSFFTMSSRGGARHYAAVYPKSFFGEIWLLDADGKVLPNWPVPISADGENDDDSLAGSSSIGFGSPLLFAHNNSLRIAFVSQAGGLSVFDESGSVYPPFPVMLEGIFYQQPVFDGDFLWLVSADGTFFRVSLEGEVLSQNIAGFSVKEEGYITTYDCDGDKIPEVFITGEGNALYAYSRNFRSLEGFPLPIWGKPVFTENNKGKTEITGLGMDRRLYRWQFR
ncbi:MAG: PQQ-like beta-propeller repeat protein [Treponema sp.]|jgi:hypothetical protein|nr:PQQ-like beta-propeller repeat protein [Treponema sp.]